MNETPPFWPLSCNTKVLFKFSLFFDLECDELVSIESHLTLRFIQALNTEARNIKIEEGQTSYNPILQ